jgi:hydrogenase maturation factor
VDKNEANKLVDAFNSNGILSCIIGDVAPKDKGLKIIKENEERNLVHPITDPYWALAAQFSK